MTCAGLPQQGWQISGFGGSVICEALNHITASRMARVYVRSRRLDDQAKAFNALADSLKLLVDGDQSANIVRLCSIIVLN
jgi:hypothetical protein